MAFVAARNGISAHLRKYKVQRQQKREMVGGENGRNAKFTKYEIVNVIIDNRFKTPSEVKTCPNA